MTPSTGAAPSSTTPRWPPDPGSVGVDRWRELWKRRIDASACIRAFWMQHQRRDAYWKHGSVCEDFAAIECPCSPLAAGSTAPRRRCCAGRELDGAVQRADRAVGPQGATASVPGPAIGFPPGMQALVGPLAEGRRHRCRARPPYSALADGQTPRRSRTSRQRPGAGSAFPNGPPRRREPCRFFHRTPAFPKSPASGRREWYARRRRRGCAARNGAPMAKAALPGKRYRSARRRRRSICFDSAPLTDDLHLVGVVRGPAPVAADGPRRFVAVRLTDVAPDGIRLSSSGRSELAHRRSHEQPEPPTPVSFMRLTST